MIAPRRKNGKKKAPGTVAQYLSLIRPDAAESLQKLRTDLLKLLPGAEEVISYQIPTIKYKGKLFIAFAAFRDHCGLYTMSHALMKKLEIDLKNYETSGVTIRFPVGSKLPVLLLRKIVSARKKELALREKARKLAGKKYRYPG